MIILGVKVQVLRQLEVSGNHHISKSLVLTIVPWEYFDNTFKKQA